MPWYKGKAEVIKVSTLKTKARARNMLQSFFFTEDKFKIQFSQK
jgi:hypothetical protein